MFDDEPSRGVSGMEPRADAALGPLGPHGGVGGCKRASFADTCKATLACFSRQTARRPRGWRRIFVLFLTSINLGNIKGGAASESSVAVCAAVVATFVAAAAAAAA